MNDSTVNVPLLRKAVEWAEAEAAKPWDQCLWYQGDWVAPEGEVARYGEVKCGTAYCIAGYAAMLTLGKGESFDECGGIVDAKGRDVEHASERARRELGIDTWEAERLFSAGNDIDRVRYLAEEIAGEPL